jgi:DNA invertase Pin-like site-specific DNA recombinase
MKVALYLRVSTDEQTNEPQRIELLEYCQRRGWTIAREYVDKASGAKVSRLGFETMMADVRRGKLDAVVCVKLDRLGRSLQHLAGIFGELEENKVALVVTSQAIDTTDSNPAGRLQLHLLAAFAEFEKSLILERTMAGLKSARARGVTLGRPSTVHPEQAAIVARFKSLRAYAKSVGEKAPSFASLAKELGCSVGKAFSLAKGAA